MFRVRFFTPALLGDQGEPQAGAELSVGTERLRFIVDLRHWRVPDYEQQWRGAIARLLHGAPSTALMMAYGGPGEAVHHMWGLWRDGQHVYVQGHPVHTAADVPFDPDDPYQHVGERIRSSDYALPIPEWRVDLMHVYAAALGIRWPLYP